MAVTVQIELLWKLLLVHILGLCNTLFSGVYATESLDSVALSRLQQMQVSALTSASFTEQCLWENLHETDMPSGHRFSPTEPCPYDIFLGSLCPRPLSYRCLHFIAALVSYTC